MVKSYCSAHIFSLFFKSCHSARWTNCSKWITVLYIHLWWSCLCLSLFFCIVSCLHFCISALLHLCIFVSFNDFICVYEVLQKNHPHREKCRKCWEKSIGKFRGCIIFSDGAGEEEDTLIPALGFSFSSKFILNLFEFVCRAISDTKTLGALRAPTSSWRPFGPLDFILCALRS